MKTVYVCLECGAVVSARIRFHVEAFRHYFYSPHVVP